MRTSLRALSVTLISTLAFTVLPPATAANLDDGYPKDSAAPGRTCPMAEEGFKTVSDYSGKTLVCTMINGTKKWWIEGDPLPEAAPAGTSTVTVPEIQITHTYLLPATSLAKMKVSENVVICHPITEPTARSLSCLKVL